MKTQGRGAHQELVTIVDNIVFQYKESMRGVDFLDSLISLYIIKQDRENGTTE